MTSLQPGHGTPLTPTPAQIADQVVPQYRAPGSRYPCHGIVAKRWGAAYEAAALALGAGK